MTREEHFMQIAIALAKEAAIQDEVPVGAIIVKNDEIIGTGSNAPLGKNDPTAHAEILAIREAAIKLGNYRLVDCELYVTLEPCAMCCGAIQHARISRLIYGARDLKTGCCGSVFNLMQEKKLNHHAHVLGDVLAEECGQVLSDFFFHKRQAKKKNT